MAMKVVTSTGKWQDLDELGYSCVYDANGQMTSKVWTDGAWTWTQTFTWVNGLMTVASAPARSL